MRYKAVPEPRDLDFLATAQESLPLVPGSVEDCCVRLVNATDLDSRERAREYVVFIEALELVEETPRGYVRRRVEVDRERVAEAFERRVYGVEELLDVIAVEGSLDVDEAFANLRSEVPRWERSRHPDWEAEWRERTERLLEWAATFGLLVRQNGEYRSREGP